MTTAEIHTVARGLGAAARSSLEESLRSVSGGPPGWLTLDPSLLGLVRTWLETSTYSAERDFLRDHPELLGAQYALAVDEVSLLLLPEEQTRLRDLRSRAREAGVEAAWRPLVLAELAKAFVVGTLEQQSTLMAERRDELLDPTVRAQIEAGPDEPASRRAVALLDLAADPYLYLDRAFAALQHPKELRELLGDAAADSTSPAALDPLARLARTSDDPDQQARGVLFHALARHLADDVPGRNAALEELRTLDPDGLPAWAAELAALAARQPAAAALIQPLFHQPN